MWLPGGDAGIDGVGWSESFPHIGGGEGVWLMVKKCQRVSSGVGIKVQVPRSPMIHYGPLVVSCSQAHVTRAVVVPPKGLGWLFKGADSDNGA